MKDFIYEEPASYFSKETRKKYNLDKPASKKEQGKEKADKPKKK